MELIGKIDIKVSSSSFGSFSYWRWLPDFGAENSLRQGGINYERTIGVAVPRYLRMAPRLFTTPKSVVAAEEQHSKDLQIYLLAQHFITATHYMNTLLVTS